MVDFCYEAHFGWFKRVLIRDFNVNLISSTYTHIIGQCSLGDGAPQFPTFVGSHDGSLETTCLLAYTAPSKRELVPRRCASRD